MLICEICGKMKDYSPSAIEISGENKTVCDIAQTASAKKVFIAGVTNFPNSSLAGIADVTLLTASDEKQFRIGATTSRIAQYLVIDFLIISLALKNMKKSEENVLRTSEMIDDSANGLTKKYQAKRK